MKYDIDSMANLLEGRFGIKDKDIRTWLIRDATVQLFVKYGATSNFEEVEAIVNCAKYLYDMKRMVELARCECFSNILEYSHIPASYDQNKSNLYYSASEALRYGASIEDVTKASKLPIEHVQELSERL